MFGMKGRDYVWKAAWIEFKAPNEEGVYCIRDNAGKALFVGSGKLKESLLGHWNRRNAVDAAIWSHAPYSFCFELTNNPPQREAELIHAFKPCCNQIALSRFHHPWWFPRVG